MTDPIADMIVRINNAVAVRHDFVLVPLSKIKMAAAKVLEAEGYVKAVSTVEDKGRSVIRIDLKYTPIGQSVIHGMKRVSRPGQRIYSPTDQLRRLTRGLGTLVVSTSSGVMTNREAKKANLGGEVLFKVW